MAGVESRKLMLLSLACSLIGVGLLWFVSRNYSPQKTGICELIDGRYVSVEGVAVGVEAAGEVVRFNITDGRCSVRVLTGSFAPAEMMHVCVYGKVRQKKGVTEISGEGTC